MTMEGDLPRGQETSNNPNSNTNSSSSSKSNIRLRHLERKQTNTTTVPAKVAMKKLKTRERSIQNVKKREMRVVVNEAGGIIKWLV